MLPVKHACDRKALSKTASAMPQGRPQTPACICEPSVNTLNMKLPALPVHGPWSMESRHETQTK